MLTHYFRKICSISIPLLLFSGGLLSSNAKWHPDTSGRIQILHYPVITNILDNPSFTGFHEKHTINFAYQSNYLNFQDYPQLFRVSYDVSILKKKKTSIGLGLSYYDFHFNTEKHSILDFLAAIRIKLSKDTRLSLGISLISFNKHPQPDRDKSFYPDQLDPMFAPVYATYDQQEIFREKYLDMKSGLWLIHHQYFAGISLLHIAQIPLGKKDLTKSIDKKSPQPLALEINFVTGKEFEINEKLKLTPLLKIKKTEFLPYDFSPTCYVVHNSRNILGLAADNMKIADIKAGIFLLDHLSIVSDIGFPIDKDLRSLSRIYQFGAGLQIII